MVFLIRELEFLVEWFIRDWEDLLYPWIVYQTRSRGLKISKVFVKLCAVKILKAFRPFSLKTVILFI